MTSVLKTPLARALLRLCFLIILQKTGLCFFPLLVEPATPSDEGHRASLLPGRAGSTGAASLA